MRRNNRTYPQDILICLFISLLLVPLVIFNIEPTLRLILGLPFILFIPSGLRAHSTLISSGFSNALGCR